MIWCCKIYLRISASESKVSKTESKRHTKRV
nr:MAG TPA: hypothetical protein [Caudoviricetes sp.]DAJ10639.1 MAG TPA: hypothetical protein [Caudoviricetes sp.]